MAQSKLLREHDHIISAALAKAKELGVYLVLRINRNDEYSLRWRDGGIEDVSINSSAGVGMYVFTKSGYVAFGSTNVITLDAVIQMLNNTAEVAEANEKIGADKAVEIYDLPRQANLGEDELHYQVIDMANMPQAKLASFAAEAEQYIKSEDPTARVFLRFSIHQSQWRIIRSDGTDVDFAIPYTVAVASFTIEKDGTQSTGYAPYFTPMPNQLLTKMPQFKQLLADELKLASDQLTAKRADAGNYPIVITDKLVGLLVHEALGHPTESDAVAEDNSVLGDAENKFKVGERVAAKGVTVTDHEEGLSHGFHPYGAFGNKRESVTLIQDGILKESISDIFTADKIGTSNKNAERSEHYGAVAIPRMSTTYLELSGDKLLADKLTSNLPDDLQKLFISKGIFDKYPKVYYLIGGRGGQVSPKSGDFMFGTGYVYELTKDSVTAMKPVSFSGNVLEALKAIEFGVGELRKDGVGICGKAGQSAYVNDGGHELVFFRKTKHVSIA